MENLTLCYEYTESTTLKIRLTPEEINEVINKLKDTYGFEQNVMIENGDVRTTATLRYTKDGKGYITLVILSNKDYKTIEEVQQLITQILSEFNETTHA